MFPTRPNPIRRVRKAAGLREDGRATEGNTIGWFGFFYEQHDLPEEGENKGVGQ
jgi:hypothetical protein